MINRQGVAKVTWFTGRRLDDYRRRRAVATHNEFNSMEVKGSHVQSCGGQQNRHSKII